MPRILITGMSGVGKSTLLSVLGNRGHRVIDTDYGTWKTADGLWDEMRLSALLDSAPSVVVAGTVENQGRFYDRFDHVVLLSAPEDVILSRVACRTNNHYGRTESDRREIRTYLQDVEPRLRATATEELHGTDTPDHLADRIEHLLRD
ncbi:dephospho-CoA kinase [Microbacterium foliorum]|uniref:AAA family ATPase n=1 Tax=Microbacterium foliorum TaxID=104336 RepID=UPI00209DC1C4|nr:AAA family ATPase [Microbacterium foliorum]MCP1428335.1 dephospho-CoA kinase [Microbacterium foliorum]